jgi:hypothetical protein
MKGNHPMVRLESKDPVCSVQLFQFELTRQKDSIVQFARPRDDWVQDFGFKATKVQRYYM